MKITKSNRSSVLWLLVLATVVGTLAWELGTRLLGLAGLDIDLTAGPIGFDLYALAIWIRVNPGTIAGLAVGWIGLSRL